MKLEQEGNSSDGEMDVCVVLLSQHPGNSYLTVTFCALAAFRAYARAIDVTPRMAWHVIKVSCISCGITIESAV